MSSHICWTWKFSPIFDEVQWPSLSLESQCLPKDSWNSGWIEVNISFSGRTRGRGFKSGTVLGVSGRSAPLLRQEAHWVIVASVSKQDCHLHWELPNECPSWRTLENDYGSLVRRSCSGYVHQNLDTRLKVMVDILEVPTLFSNHWYPACSLGLLYKMDRTILIPELVSSPGGLFIFKSRAKGHFLLPPQLFCYEGGVMVCVQDYSKRFSQPLGYV